MRFTLIVAGLAATIGTAIIAGSAFFFRHHQSQKVSAQTAEAEFRLLRARFADQRPLLDMNARRVPADAAQPRASTPLHSFHTLIFDTRGGQRLVRITVPYRIGRLFARRGGFRWLGELTFMDDTEFDPEPIHLAIDQVEGHGPGLIVDYRHATGGQFIAWVD